MNVDFLAKLDEAREYANIPFILKVFTHSFCLN